jgi:hypothetical protein
VEIRQSGDVGQDVLHHAVGEVSVLGILAEIREREDDDRRARKALAPVVVRGCLRLGLVVERDARGPHDARRRHVVRPGEGYREREAERDQNGEDLGRPVGCRDDVEEEIAATDHGNANRNVGQRDADDPAPLELRPEAHESRTERTTDLTVEGSGQGSYAPR